MKIVYIPLDERPCNTDYPVQAAQAANDLEIIQPPFQMMGRKKVPGDISALSRFLLEESTEADAAVVSTEMVVYGGLVPSRLHHLKEDHLNQYAQTMRKLKETNKDLKVYVSNLIMRTPRYSSDDEEPDYYGAYGEQIFRYGWLKDKNNRDGLTKEEAKDYAHLQETIPFPYINDYEKRRQFNVAVNQLNISLLAEGAIDFLVIPQDDAAEYGYTALDQQTVFQAMNQDTSQQVMIYPGADEVGFTLLARAYNEQKNRRPKVFPVYSSTLGPSIVPLYEDRPINETMKAHVMASGGELVYSPEEADMLLAYNTPGKKMQESWVHPSEKDVTYSSYRHLPTFVNDIEHYLKKGVPVVVADSAYSNGGDRELIQLLNSKKLLHQLTSYKAWNTNGNTVGSTLAAGMFALGNPASKKVADNLLLHLLDDFLYQSIVRMPMTDHVLPGMGLNYFDLGEKKEEVAESVKDNLLHQSQTYLTPSFSVSDFDFSVEFPWNRMFEIHCRLSSGSDK